MDKEPIIPQRVEYWTLDQLFERSLQEMRKSLGVPKVIEADKIQQVIGDSNVTEGKKEGG